MRLSVVVAVLLMVGCAPARESSGSHAKSGGNVPPPDPPANASLGTERTYVIGVEDVLRIDVWREPELTSTLRVRSDGKISLPLVNDVTAAGLTPMDLAASLTMKLKKYFDDPRVTVVVAEMNHQRVYVIGEVLRHGVLPLSPNMTVLQALATTGLTQFASTKKIYVLRVGNGVQQRFPVNYKRLIKGQHMEQNILLAPEDTIVVP